MILEGDADAGEESPSESMFHAWVVDDTKLALAGTVRRGLGDTRDFSAVNGFMRTMFATVAGTDAAKGPPREMRVAWEMKLVGGKLLGDAPADPKPEWK